MRGFFGFKGVVVGKRSLVGTLFFSWAWFALGANLPGPDSSKPLCLRDLHLIVFDTRSLLTRSPESVQNDLQFKTRREYFEWTLTYGLSPFSLLLNVKLSPAMISQIQARILKGSKDLHRVNLSQLTSLFHLINDLAKRSDLTPEQITRLISTEEYPNISAELIEFALKMDSVWIKDIGLISAQEYFMVLEHAGLSDDQIQKILSEALKREITIAHLARTRTYLAENTH